jgi:hypothetical protein
MLLARLSVGALLLAGATACADDGDRATPPATPDQSASSTTSSTAAQQSAPTATADAGSSGTSLPERPPVALDDALIDAARAEGTVSVIVTLDIPYRPEAELAGPAEVAAQRAAIAAAQDELAASVPSASVTTRMTLFPQLVMSVDEDGLRQLAVSPLVFAIDENSLSAPTT